MIKNLPANAGDGSLIPGWGRSLYFTVFFKLRWGFPGGSVVKNLPANVGSLPQGGRSPGEGNGQPTPVFLPGKSYGQRSLTDYSPWDHKRVGHDSAPEK